MARRGNPYRDANGRFASGPGGGGGGGLGAARKARSPGARRKAGAMAGGTLAARTSLKASRTKADAITATPQQRGAATRASRKLAAAKVESRRTGPKVKGVIGGKAAKQGKKLARRERSQLGLAAHTAAGKSGTIETRMKAYSRAVRSRGAKMLRDFQASGKKKAAPATPKPATQGKAAKGSAQADARAKAMAERQAKARKIKEMVNRKGVVRGKNFNDGKDVSTMSMAELRRAVRQDMKRIGVTTKKEFRFMAQQDPPKTRSGWENLYRTFISTPASERNRKARPGVINGIDIQKNFRPWAVFGLNPKTATNADIQSAFRRVAKQVHPDMGGRAKDLERVKIMRDSILAMRSMGGGSKAPKRRGKGKAAPTTSSATRPRGPLLLPPAKTTAKPKRRRGKT